MTAYQTYGVPINYTDMMNSNHLMYSPYNMQSMMQNASWAVATSSKMVPNRTCSYCGGHTAERRCENCGAPR